jgi:hypothetical protein
MTKEKTGMNETLYCDPEEHISLCEALDRVLNKGVVIHGDIMISVAGIDLVYLGLRLLLSSVETARKAAVLPIGMGSDVAIRTFLSGENPEQRS